MAACLSPNFFFVLASPRVPSRQRDVQACGVTRRCECIDLHKDLVPYKNAWDWQKNILKKRHSCIELDEDFSDTLITLQHPPVYTLGTASSEEYLNFDRKDAPYEIFQTERGGEVTYHGPGQLVMYPIINLRYHKMDLHWYLRRLEEVVIRVLSSTFSIKASRLEGLTGVWVGNQKLAAIGIRVSRWVTYHGLALNVTTDLSPFKQIVPCGIRDRQVGSIKGLLLEEFSSLSSPQLLDITDKSLLKEFSEVFELDLIPTIRRSYNPTRFQHGSRDYNIYKTLLFAQAVFKACNGPGAVEEARVYFECMKDSFGVTPTMEHYLCLVDLLGKSGKFQEAKELVDRIPSKPSPLVLRDTLKLHLKI